MKNISKIFTKKYTERRIFNSKRILKRYYENKKQISNQENFINEKNRDNLLQKQNNR